MWDDIKRFIIFVLSWSLLLGFGSGFFIHNYFQTTQSEIMEDAYRQNYTFKDEKLQKFYKTWLNEKLEERK